MPKRLSSPEAHESFLVRSCVAALRHALAHEIEESELTSGYTVLINEATGEIASKDCTQIVVWYLYGC
jgi:hypothetical protein